MYDVTVEHNVGATMRDGTVLRADVYRPTAAGPWPVLLTLLPYGKHLPGLIRMTIDPLGMARGGYIVAVQDTRGRFSSDGDWEPWTFEAGDGYDSVRWAAALPGSNGVVGMFGVSYFGNTPWMAALSKPPELKAIAPAVTWSEPNDGLFSRGGVPELGTSVYWSLLQGADTLLRRHADDPAALSAAIIALIAVIDDVAKTAYWELPAEHHPAFARHGIAELGFERSQREPEWSASCRVAGRQSEVEVPSLHIGGWYDIFCQGTLDNFTALQSAGRPASLIIGSWAHANNSGYLGDVNFGLASSAEFLGFRSSLTDIQNGWFGQHLVPESAADETASAQPVLPPVLLFVMGTNEWREEQEWPLSRTVETKLFLRSDGQLTRELPADGEGTDTYLYDPADPVITTGGAIFMSNEFRPGPLDQAAVESRPDVLVFSTEPMTEDLEVTAASALCSTSPPTPRAPTGSSVCATSTRRARRATSSTELCAASLSRMSSAPRRSTCGPQATSFAPDTASGSRSHPATFRAGRAISTPASPSKTAHTPVRPKQQIAHEAARPSHMIFPVIPREPA